MFNPAKYAYGLANSCINNGAKIYENSKVIDIKHQNGKYKVYTEDNCIESKYVVLATHFPIKNFPGAYFLKMYQDISYIIAVKSKAKIFDGYYINNKEPAISFRNVNNNVQEDLKSEMDKENAKENTDNIILISGNGHKVGRESATDNYKFLEDVAKEMFKENYEIIDRWSTQDCISMDKLPFIGRFSRLLPNIYVMTGFKKWGMTLSNVAANIVSDQIQNKENEYEELFKPSRMKIIKNAKSYKEHIKETVYGIGLNKLKLPNETIKDIKNGEGKIVIYNGRKIGVYKDENGFCNLVKPICTHLKCELQFNNTDKTWDCPCHGSRFTVKGEVINNPAVYKLKNNIKM